MFGRPKSTPRRPLQDKQQNQPVFSYYSSRSSTDTNVGRLKDGVKKSFKWKFIPSFIALGAILISLGYVLSLTTNPRMSVIGEETPLTQPLPVYQEAAERALKSSIFNRLKMIINTVSLENRLKSEFPELSEVAITIPITSRRPIVAIKAATPTVILTTNNGAFVLDSRGIVIAKSASTEQFSGLNIPVVKDESGLTLELKSGGLPPADIAFISEVVRQLTNKGVEAESLTLPAVANEFHFRPKEEGYFVKFNLQGDARLQAGTYLAVKEELAANDIKPAEYIDVRVEEKAFYK